MLPAIARCLRGDFPGYQAPPAANELPAARAPRSRTSPRRYRSSSPSRVRPRPERRDLAPPPSSAAPPARQHSTTGQRMLVPRPPGPSPTARVHAVTTGLPLPGTSRARRRAQSGAQTPPLTPPGRRHSRRRPPSQRLAESATDRACGEGAVTRRRVLRRHRAADEWPTAGRLAPPPGPAPMPPLGAARRSPADAGAATRASEENSSHPLDYRPRGARVLLIIVALAVVASSC